MHGHGGSWTGCANGKKGLIEKDVTLKIANYLKQELNKYYGVNIILTHDGVNFPNNDPGDLAARAMVARNNNADLYVSLHINDEASHTATGANVFVTSRTELYKYKEGMTLLGNKILNNLNKIGIKNNGVINDMLCNDHEPTYQYYDGSQADYYGDIRHAMKGDTLNDLGPDFSDGSGISTVLIEHCYMNSSDSQFIDSEEDLRKIAKADADAIVDYLGLKLPGTFISEMNVDKESANLLIGETTKINVTLGPANITDKTVKWVSNNENIAKVDANGNITAIGEGKAVITVTSNNNPSLSKRININVEKEEVKFEKETENIILGKSKILNAKITPTWIENKNIKWESSNTDILEIDNTGEIITKSEGTAKVKVTWLDKNLSDELTINVIKLPENTKYEINKYKVNNNQISMIGPKISIEEFLKNIEISDNLEAIVETVTKEQKYIGTNTKLKIKEKEHGIILEEYECLIYGDVNCDGKISSLDYTLVKNHIMDVKKITDKNIVITSDINADGKISSLDYTLIKNDIMDVKKITQK